ncbi:uncharacterized protein LOC117792542 [Drosophila innubila]|uniref:uncharacterized protein LOC117792542 n=1 Tax=Drosophila innubila TaxID=198719 RepID=UPI00148E0782|nr:uncharacterized protein LOC117792542 [Drosophila innubila]
MVSSCFCLTLLSLYFVIINCQQQSTEMTKNVVLIKPIKYSCQEPAAIVFGNPPRHRFGRRRMFINNVKKNEIDITTRRTRRRKLKYFWNNSGKATTAKGLQ